MYLIKIMSDQDLPDDDMTKNYKMIAIGPGDQFEFYHDQTSGHPFVCVTPKEGESYHTELTGNVYVISVTGKTVATHWARSLWGKGEGTVVGPEYNFTEGPSSGMRSLGPHNTVAPHPGIL